MANQVSSRVSLLVFCLLIAMSTAPLCATTDDRIALVIGNSAYKSARLDSAANDATDVAEALRELRFRVIVARDLSLLKMNETLGTFLRESANYNVRLIYYAGHGVQLLDKSYMVPVDADLKRPEHVRHQALHFEPIADKLALIQSGVNIIILDTCRDNPFVMQGAVVDGHYMGLRDEEQDMRDEEDAMRASPPPRLLSGIAPLKQPVTGTFIAFAAQAGYKARANVSERNSFFSKHMLKNIQTMNQRVGDLFEQVRRGVKEDTKGRQIPIEQTTLTGPFCFRELDNGCR